MKPSENCYDFIKREEGGYYLSAYRDQAGIWTIGWGSTMYKNGSRVKKGDTITLDQAKELLEWEINNKTAFVSGLTSKVVLNQNQFDALVSFAFNCGVGALEKSTLLKLIIQNPHDPNIRDAFTMWSKITDPKTGQKTVSIGLLKRRKREADLYFKDV